jgi:small subunit ribosomal protein S4
MSIKIGARLKIMRALGIDLPGLSRKSITNRTNPPGQHGPNSGRRRKSEYGLALMEKQKLRFNYGVSERQLRSMMVRARRKDGPSGEILLQMLECRLDNVVFRAGWAPTIPAARQLVSHCHILLNGKRANVASIRLKPGDEVSVRNRSRAISMVVNTSMIPSLERPEWLDYDEMKFTAKVTRLPEADEVPFPIEIHLVVELYAKSM